MQPAKCFRNQTTVFCATALQNCETVQTEGRPNNTVCPRRLAEA